MGRFLTFSVWLILIPGTLQHKQAAEFTFSLTPPSASERNTTEPEPDSVFLYQHPEKPVAITTFKEKVQASSTQRTSSDNTAEKALPLIVSTQVQAENLLDQGYSVSDIAKELQLSRKEVRKLKRRLKNEEKEVIQQRKKDKKKNSRRNS